MAKPKTRRRSSGSSVLLMLALLFVGAIAAIGTILLVGDLKLPFLNRSVAAQEKKNDDHTGKVAVALCARPVNAYTMVQLESLVDPRTKQARVQWIDADKAKARGFITNAGELIGRVMGRDKMAGYAFTESDFLPKGTPASPLAGIDPGMRGLYVKVEQIQGLDLLRRGDRFDLMAVKPAASSKDRSANAAYANPQVEATQADEKLWNTAKRVLVQNGKVIVPASASELPRGKPEVFIAVGQDEVEGLTSALATGTQVICVSRSSLAGVANEPLAEPEMPLPPDSIQVISGAKSSVTIVPKSGGDESMDPSDPSDNREPHGGAQSLTNPPKSADVAKKKDA